jgi:hypothetical protein
VTAERPEGALHELFRLLAERLESLLEGEELALDDLGEELSARFGAEDLQAAVLVLRSLVIEIPGTEESQLDPPPAGAAPRVPSAEELELVTPEAWDALALLKHDGTLDAAQFERVMGALGALGERQVGVERAMKVASRVALDETDETAAETTDGGFEVWH